MYGDNPLEVIINYADKSADNPRLVNLLKAAKSYMDGLGYLEAQLYPAISTFNAEMGTGDVNSIPYIARVRVANNSVLVTLVYYNEAGELLAREISIEHLISRIAMVNYLELYGEGKTYERAQNMIQEVLARADMGEEDEIE